MIHIKGDLPNFLLNFPRFDPSDLVPWVESVALSEEKTAEQIATKQNDVEGGARGLEHRIARAAGLPRQDGLSIITPGASSGELLHELSSLERRFDRWDVDPESARDALSAAVSRVLRLRGRDPDPPKSREHVLLFRRRLRPRPRRAVLDPYEGVLDGNTRQSHHEPRATVVRDA